MPSMTLVGITQCNARKTASITNPSTGNYLELDLWIPSLNLCFEYQGLSKEQGIIAKGDTLIVVPYWWDSKPESLVSTIRHQRPDIVDKHFKYAPCIPLNPPPSESLKQLDGTNIPDVGDLMLASFPLTVSFSLSLSPRSPWWLGEKYDGLRCCWNPKRDTLYTRYVNEIDLPQNMKSKYPKIFLDMELWCGRGEFQDTQKLVTHDESDTNWSYLRSIMFDKPDYHTRGLSFEDRYTLLLQSYTIHHPFLIIAPRVLCTNARRLSLWLNDILQNSGEGVVLRKPRSPYKAGRTRYLFKLKSARADKEALVVDRLPNGDIQLQLPDGTMFFIEENGENDFNTDVARGDVVTFSYDQISRRDLPTNPKIVRVRRDLSWLDVIREEKKNDSVAFSHYHTLQVASYTDAPRGHYQNEKNVRLLMENYAKQSNFDPLVAENWYNVSRSDFVAKSGVSFLKYYEYSLNKALLKIFPEIGLEESKFKSQSRTYWSSAAEKRKVFDEFAKEQGFDPLVPANWYSKNLPLLRSAEISKKHKNIQTVVAIYKGSLIRALAHLYPEIGLEARKFSIVPVGYWDNWDNRRNFFERYARDNNFDPLVAENWYPCSTDKFKARKGGKPVLSKYSGSAIDALVDIFPEVHFQISLFNNNKRNTFKDVQSRREFLKGYAKEHKFDYLDPDNWKGVAKKSKALQSVTRYHKNRIHQTLYDLFPEELRARNKSMGISFSFN